MPCRQIVVEQPFDNLLGCCRACPYVTTGDHRARLCDGLSVYDAALLVAEDHDAERMKDLL